jgi:transposase
MVNKVSLPELWPGLADFTLQNMISSEKGWAVEAEGKSLGICPGCGAVSKSRHSRYWRTVKDLPVQGVRVTLKLKLGRWRCQNSECERQIFTERVPAVLAPYARQTNRFSETVTLVSHALGGPSRRATIASARHAPQPTHLAAPAQASRPERCGGQ